MKIKRLRITLPARMKHTAHHDARLIAERLAMQIHQTGTDQREFTVAARGQSASTLGLHLSQAARGKGGGHGR